MDRLSEIYFGSTSLGILTIVFLIWNLIVFALYGADKAKSRKGAWRIPEKTLLLCAFFLGGAGAWTGMKLFHHKTKHTVFRVLVPLFTVLNFALIAFLLYRKMHGGNSL